MNKNEYTVVIDLLGCSNCGHGRTWHVVDPEGIADGVSYFDEEDAKDFAALLNDAYLKGLEAGRK